jgi:hypothetical protein
MHVHPRAAAVPTPDVGDRLEMGCSAHRLSLRDLGDRAGLPVNRIYLIKTGRSPIARHARGLAEVLRCDENWLISGDGPPPSWAADHAASLLKRSLWRKGMVPRPMAAAAAR